MTFGTDSTGKGCKIGCGGRRCDNFEDGCVNLCKKSSLQCNSGDCDNDPYAPGLGCCQRKDETGHPSGCDCCADCKGQGDTAQCYHPSLWPLYDLCAKCFRWILKPFLWEQIHTCCGDDDIDFHGCGVGQLGIGLGCISR